MATSWGAAQVIDSVQVLPFRLFNQDHQYVSTDDLKGYNYVVYATYASLNNFTDNEEDYQFELCEKPVLKLPSI